MKNRTLVTQLDASLPEQRLQLRLVFCRSRGKKTYTTKKKKQNRRNKTEVVQEQENGKENNALAAHQPASQAKPSQAKPSQAQLPGESLHLCAHPPGHIPQRSSRRCSNRAAPPGRREARRMQQAPCRSSATAPSSLPPHRSHCTSWSISPPRVPAACERPSSCSFCVRRMPRRLDMTTTCLCTACLPRARNRVFLSLLGLYG